MSSTHQSSYWGHGLRPVCVDTAYFTVLSPVTHRGSRALRLQRRPRSARHLCSEDGAVCSICVSVCATCAARMVPWPVCTCPTLRGWRCNVCACDLRWNDGGGATVPCYKDGATMMSLFSIVGCLFQKPEYHIYCKDGAAASTPLGLFWCTANRTLVVVAGISVYSAL